MTSDPVDFDDPLAWGFCQYCAFLVACDLESGRMLVHERRSGGWTMVRCYGSHLETTEQPGPETRPKGYEDVIAEALTDEENGSDNVEE